MVSENHRIPKKRDWWHSFQLSNSRFISSIGTIISAKYFHFMKELFCDLQKKFGMGCYSSHRLKILNHKWTFHGAKSAIRAIYCIADLIRSLGPSLYPQFTYFTAHLMRKFHLAHSWIYVSYANIHIMNRVEVDISLTNFFRYGMLSILHGYFREDEGNLCWNVDWHISTNLFLFTPFTFTGNISFLLLTYFLFSV